MGQCPPKAGTDNVVCGPPIYHGCWSIPERVQIERIRYLCEKCPQLEFDGGQTDEGDPWCIVYDQAGHQIILHIARIDRRYLIVCPGKGSEKAASIRTAIEIALKRLTEHWSAIIP